MGRVAEELPASDSFSFLQLSIRPPPSTHTAQKNQVRVGRSRTPTPGRAGFRHVILSLWAAGLGGADSVREAPGSVAAVGSGETATAAPSCPSSLPAPSPRPQDTSTTTANFGIFLDPKKSRWGGVPQKLRTEDKV